MTEHVHGTGANYLKGCPGCRERGRTLAQTTRQSAAGARASRIANWKRQGMDPDTAGAVWDDSDSCEACGGPKAVVDHNHTSGVVRGTLCTGCNRALGFLADDPARLRSLANYLEKYE